MADPTSRMRTFTPRFASSGTAMPANFPAAFMANIKGSFSDIINLSGLPVIGPNSLKTSLSLGNE
jgi:hypothetical protein